jgi:ATP-dependent DNA helicase RecG
MLTPEEVKALAAEIESDRVERKRSFSDPDGARQAVCAFANDLPGHKKPGYLLIGIEDDGRFAGLHVTDELLRKLSDMRSDGHIQPLPSMTVYRVEVDRGVFVAVVEVQPSSAPPVRLRGRVHVRVGPRRAIATIEEERRLAERRVAGALTFDQQPARGSTLDDLDVDLFRREYLPKVVAPEVLAENRRSPEDQLASLRFLDPATDLPTHAGILVVGRDPLRWLPGAYVQFVRIQGVDRAAPVLDSHRLSENLVGQAQALDRLLRIQIRVARVPTGGLVHEDVPDYPIEAVREVIVNAVMHRSYDGSHAPVMVYWFSDRVEVLSPGGLYGPVTPENFGTRTAYRNPVLAEAMRALGLVERFGVGIARVREALAKNGNPPAEFQFDPVYVLVTIRPRPAPL